MRNTDNDAAIQNNFGYEEEPVDRSSIEAEISQLESELAQAQAELQRMQSQATEYEKAQDNDPEWATARRNYIDSGDMSGITGWYNRYDQRKRDKADEDYKNSVLAGNGRDSNEAIRKAARNVEYALEDYQDTYKALTKNGEKPISSLKGVDLITLDGMRKKYNRAVDSYRDMSGSSEDSYEKYTKHPFEDEKAGQPKPPAQEGEGSSAAPASPAEPSRLDSQTDKNKFDRIKTAGYKSTKITRAQKAEAMKVLQEALQAAVNEDWYNDANQLYNDISGMETAEDYKIRWNADENDWLKKANEAGRRKPEVLTEAQKKGHLKGYYISEGKLKK